MPLSYHAAPTRSITAANGVNYAYRDFGTPDGPPVVLFTHLAATLENWDPRIVDVLGTQHRVIAFDNRGVGSSSGQVPASIPAMAEDAAAFIEALDLRKISVFSFSLGGMVAQELIEKRPGLVERLVLTGTGGRGGEGISRVALVTFADMARGLLHRVDPKRFLFFTHDASGAEAARSFLESINGRTKDRDLPISTRGFLRQLRALRAWGRAPRADLASIITVPTLIANGDDDRMVPTSNSYDLDRRIPGSELIIYPNSGHGGIFEHHHEFAPKASAFLHQERASR